MGTITCKKCKTEKEANEYYALNKTCKKCRAQWCKTYYIKNKKKLLENIREYQKSEKHKAFLQGAKNKLNQKIWREQHREEMKEYRINGIRSLSKWYIMKVLISNHGYDHSEITPRLIRETKLQILKFRAKHKTMYWDGNE